MLSGGCECVRRDGECVRRRCECEEEGVCECVRRSV